MRARGADLHFYRSLVDELPAAVCVCARAGDVEYTNARWTACTGTAAESLEPLSLGVVVHPEDHDVLRRSWDDAVSRGGGFSALLRLRDREGGYPSFRVECSPMSDRATATPRWLFLLQELEVQPAPSPSEVLTVQGLPEVPQGRGDTLDLDHMRLDLLLEAAGAGLLEYDFGSGRVHWSDQVYRLLGLDRDSTVPSPAAFKKVVHLEDWEMTESRVRDALRMGTVLIHELRVVPPGGPARWLSIVGRASYDEGGRPQRMTLICLDVTQRKATEEAVRQSEEKFAALFYGSSALMVLTSLEEGRVLDVNRRTLQVTGCTREDMLGRRLLDFLTYRDPGEHGRVLACLRDYGRIMDREVEFLDRDGKAWVGLMSSEVFCLQGDSFVLTSVWDITRLKAAEGAARSLNAELEATVRELRETNRHLQEARDAAESASRLKSEFLAMMSHEIRTPLSGVMGMHSLLLGMDLGAREREMVSLAQASARSLLSVLTDILDLSRAEADRLVLEPAPFCMEALMREATDLLASAARDRGIDLRLDCAPAPHREVLGDAGRLRQVLLHLVGNAVKFTPSGHVRVSLDASPTADQDLAFTLIVEDTGIGIPTNHLESIFEPFTQVEAGLARRYGGGGLGLALCKRLLTMMGGKIDVVSTPGKGSRFTVTLTLPRVTSEAPPSSGPNGHGAQPAPEEDGRPIQVLLVEDNELNQAITVALLQRLGCIVDLATDGIEALQVLEGKSYEIIFMDCQMPVMDGLQATAEIRRRGGGASRTPIVALTAHVLAADRKRCREAGMDDYLPKPVEMDQLASTLARWVRRPVATLAPSRS